MIIGIDLGTTNSAAAHMTSDGPVLIPNALGEVLTPSVVGMDPDGRLVVGRGAKRTTGKFSIPDRAALFKRYMGSDWTTVLGGRKFTPEQLSGMVLRSLREDAEAHLGAPVGAAVITVPAYFNGASTQSDAQCGPHRGGSKSKRILERAHTSAAIAYGLHQSDEERLLAIVDLGGGTFDVSIVEQFSGTREVRASSGESFLGGEDFTRTIAARVLETQGYRFEPAELEAAAAGFARMIQQCEAAKCRAVAARKRRPCVCQTRRANFATTRRKSLLR